MSVAGETRKAKAQPPACPHCIAGEPSVWDPVFEHFAHPATSSQLKFCHTPWSPRVTTTTQEDP